MFDPNETVLVPLYETDAGDAKAPAVRFKYLSARENARVWKLQDAMLAANNAKDFEAAIAKAVDLLEIGMRGTVNLFFPTDPNAPEATAKPVTTAADVAEVVSYDVLFDLALDCPTAVSLSERARKKSASPSPTSSASSAYLQSAAATASADVVPAPSTP